MSLGLDFGTIADNDGETLYSAFTKINNFLSTTTKLSNGDLEINNIRIGKGNNNLSGNTVLGNQAGSSFTSGVNNTIIGDQAGSSFTSGIENTIIGKSAGRLTTEGGANIMIGHRAGENLTNGTFNTFIGRSTGQNNQGNTQNTFIGEAAGASMTGNGNYNTFVGSIAGANAVSGNFNSFFGQGAGHNTTGNFNTMIGQYAGFNNTSGYSHVFLGINAGINQNGSHSNTFLGTYAGSVSTAYWNATAVGHNAQPNDNNTVTLGDGNITALRCQVNVITGISDARDKTDIVEISEGLEFVDKLKPITFTWNKRDGTRKGDKGAGFIAQDLLELQNESTIGENLDLVSEADPEKLEARYSNLLPVLVKAIQELSLEVKSLKSEIELLKAI